MRLRALLTRYRALASQRIVIVGSGDLALDTATLALDHGATVAGIVEVGDHVVGNPDVARELAGRGVPIHTRHTLREASGRVGEVDSVVLVALNAELGPVAGSEREIACDTICLALGSTPSVELLQLVGARLAFASALGGWVPETDEWMRTSVPAVFAAGDCAGVHEGMLADPEVARRQGRLAGIAAAQSLGSIGRREAESRAAGLSSSTGVARETDRAAWLTSQIHVSGWDVNVCQCEEVTRRELVEVKPPRYLKWDSPQMAARNLDTMLRDGPVNQDQIKRLTRAGMGPCQGRRCREQVALLLAHATRTTVEKIPMPSFRPPIRPLPLNVLWPEDELPVMREEWVSWYGIPTQFSPHWAAGMAIAEPTAQTRLIVSDE